MKIRRRNLSAALAVGTMTMTMALLAPAASHADTSTAAAVDPKRTLVDELAAAGQDQTRSFQPLAKITIPIAGVNAGAAQTCTGELSYYGDYKKERWENGWTEIGWIKHNGSCSGVYKMKVQVSIVDTGMFAISSSHADDGEGETYGPNLNIRADAGQYVPLLSWPWDLHSVGSRIQWGFQLHITWKSGWSGTNDICGTAQAIVPGAPVYAPYDDCLT